VILIDNFELFLERPSRENLQHGAALSTIARAMETYNGTLILTTNRGTAALVTHLQAIAYLHFQSGRF